MNGGIETNNHLESYNSKLNRLAGTTKNVWEIQELFVKQEADSRREGLPVQQEGERPQLQHHEEAAGEGQVCRRQIHPGGLQHHAQEGAHPDAGAQAVICAHFLLLISHNSMSLHILSSYYILHYIYIVKTNIQQLGKLGLLHFWKRAVPIGYRLRQAIVLNV